jgi:GNAT superfamily N-acetyltransferase
MRVDVVPYDHPSVVEMTAEVQAEYGRRYGGDGDVSPIDPAEFVPPAGLFLMATIDDEPVGMGGWRWGGPAEGDAEIKRMYVRDLHRRRGLARLILTELERSAREAGVRRLVLATGSAQPEAISMYRATGYTDITPFGHYAGSADAVHLAKQV